MREDQNCYSWWKDKASGPKDCFQVCFSVFGSCEGRCPYLPHWKDYKERGDIFSAYASHVSGRFVLNLKDPWVHGSLIMNLKNRTRQRRHFLKSNFFDAVKEKSMVVRTPPHEVGHMSEADWCKLIDNWSTPQKQVVSFFTQPCHQFYNCNSPKLVP